MLDLPSKIFGPVMQILKFKSDKDLLDRAHNTIYGLAASVYTKDINRALYLANNLRAGTVWSVTLICILPCFIFLLQFFYFSN